MAIETDVSNVSLLKIVATNDGVNNNNNHADWADAKLTPKPFEYADIDPFGYCGEYYDAELDMVYLRNRYYSPSIGRFITEDPIKDGLNWYAYCGNNPVMFVDPCGLYFIATNGKRMDLDIYGDAILETKSGDIIIRDGKVDTSIEYPKSLKLDVPAYDQLDVPTADENISLPNGCVATSTAMCETYYTGENINKTVEHAKYSQDGDITQIYESVQINKVYGILSYDFWIMNRILSFEEMVNEICSGKPIIAFVDWQDEGAHSIVIKGYKIEGDAQYIIYNDPYQGRELEIGYLRMLRGKIPDGNGTMSNNTITDQRGNLVK